MRKISPKVIAGILLLAGITASVAVIMSARLQLQQRRGDSAYLTLLRDAYATVQKSYVEKPDPQKLVKSMVDGMLASLDPHSAYLPPEPYKEMEVQIAGAFGGVGIELGMKEGRLTVIAPIDDTPAFRAGIHPNDHIWKIDGTSTQGMNISQAVKRMRGEKGTQVTLSILRNGNPKPLQFNLIRDIIKIKSVKVRTLEPGFGMIRISQFQERTGAEFKQALADLKTAAGGALKGLVIDLRYNPGGLLGSAVEIANCFIGDDINDTLIVSIKGRSADATRDYHATLGQKEPRYPIVVLINGGSASASEIVAGALQDHKRAIVMGRQSFGKGSVQSIFPLKGDAALKLTTARYYTPSGRSIQAKGITPDIEVGNGRPVERKGSSEMSVRELDLENRLAPREKGEEQPKAPADQPVTPRSTPPSGNAEPELEKDNQLKRALDLLKSLAVIGEKGTVWPVKR